MKLRLFIVGAIPISHVDANSIADIDAEDVASSSVAPDDDVGKDAAGESILAIGLMGEEPHASPESFGEPRGAHAGGGHQESAPSTENAG